MRLRSKYSFSIAPTGVYPSIYPLRCDLGLYAPFGKTFSDSVNGNLMIISSISGLLLWSSPATVHRPTVFATLFTLATGIVAFIILTIKCHTFRSFAEFFAKSTEVDLPAFAHSNAAIVGSELCMLPGAMRTRSSAAMGYERVCVYASTIRAGSCNKIASLYRFLVTTTSKFRIAKTPPSFVSVLMFGKPKNSPATKYLTGTIYSRRHNTSSITYNAFWRNYVQA